MMFAESIQIVKNDQVSSQNRQRLAVEKNKDEIIYIAKDIQ